MTPPPRRGSAERFAERAIGIVNDALVTTATKNERGLARARIVICALFAMRQLGLYSADIFGGKAKDTIIFVSLLAAIAISAVYLISKSAQLSRWQLIFSVVDVLLFVASTVPVVLRPEPDYTGILATPFVGSGALVAMAAGLRLNRGTAAGTSIAVLVVFAGVCVFDRWLWGERVTWGTGSVLFYAIQLGGAGLLGVLVASRTLDLAARSAEKAIEAERARERLGAYVGREVAEDALAVDEIVMGGSRAMVAVLFSDLRGFTTYSEKMTPEETVKQLNAYLEEMVAAITRRGGVVDKYIGDGIMAVFGAPRSKGDDAHRAILAAGDMQVALTRHNERRALSGLSALKMGVGVHYGAAIAGNVGTMEHAQYTIIGDVVNLASRLESATKEHDVAVLLSREVIDAARANPAHVVDVRAVGTISVRGREQQVEVFTV
ncbi:MAG: adenylate/guanylate cyclase domain-containing protein [Deltaproteobacteria bacterium]|nr:adenylate/guanylate cyclase domain-containing protein [Deltaproteobacteria bacterium]